MKTIHPSWRRGLAAFSAVTLLLSQTPLAAKPQGKSNGNGGNFPAGFAQGEKKGWGGESQPPGWSKGKKAGWQGEELPPGLMKKQGGGEEAAGTVPADSGAEEPKS